VTPEPLCSVVVPTRNRPGQVAECVASLAALDYPRARLEAIVVDDGGAFPLGPVLAPFRDRLDLTLLERPPEGNAAARNAGAAAARGDLLVFTDDDCVADPGWLRALAARAAAEPGAGVGGRSVPGADGLCASAAHLVVETGYRWSNRGGARFLASNNLALPADGFRELGGFDESYARSADRDLCDRWLLSGRPLVYEPAAVVHHRQRLDLPEFARKHFANGRGVFRFHRTHERRGGEPIRPEPGYYAALLRAALAERPRRRAAGLAALAGLAVAASAAGYYAERYARR
jgi:GT2 family glycosyltransferase